ncbi:BURP domain-containing protein 3-like [Argentina anserina]|uniref:BURP domain-containing protein 3-like n=1 Tax=Argentina anserina TaxID=57926 RepID=UPI00217634CE|nr:BURP domain-containing protein 3-like [Potentilla anserina]
MEYSRLVSLCSLLYVALALLGRSYASNDVSSDSYWQSAFPKTTIPKTLQELLAYGRPWNEGKASRYTGISKDNLNINTMLVSGSAFPIIGKDNYAEAASGKIHVEPDVTTFFLEKDLRLGKKMTLHFPKTTDAAKILHRKVAKSIPFSTTRLPQILNQFAVKPYSAEAEVIKQTIEDCEAPGIKGEDKYCATSLESLVDFTASKLGKYVQVYSTEVVNENKQEYKIGKGAVQKIGDRSVVCHKQKYLYAVFYCHEIHSTRAYVVPLVGADGTKAEAVAVCHTDTRTWNIKHFAFQALKIKPGTVPICHFLPRGNLVWVPNK